MTISVRDARAEVADRSWIESVFRDYLEDLAPDSTGMFPKLGEAGHSVPDQLARWFADRSAYLLTILQSQRPVGFALVARGQAGPRSSDAFDYRMAEFFIARPQRRIGIGRAAAPLIFDRFAGRWEISEYQRNPAAVKFWRRVVSEYSRGAYQERILNGEVRQSFVSGAQRTKPK